MGDACEYTASALLVDPANNASMSADFKINNSEFIITTSNGSVGGTSQVNFLPIRLNDGNIKP